MHWQGQAFWPHLPVRVKWYCSAGESTCQSHRESQSQTTPISRTSHRKGVFLIHVAVKCSPSGSWLVSKLWRRDPAAPILQLCPQPRRGAPATGWALAVFFTLPDMYSRLKMKGGENIKVWYIVSYQQIEIYSFCCYFQWPSGNIALYLIPHTKYLNWSQWSILQVSGLWKLYWNVALSIV